MAKEIAVCVGPDGASTFLDRPGSLVVFRRAGGAWEPAREMGVELGGVGGMGELRRRMDEIVRFLGGCRVLVARGAAGLAYFELEKAGCSTWEYAGRPADFLDLVWEQEEAEQAADSTRAAPDVPVPEERSPGHYFISIKGVQYDNSDLSSKQVLRGFIRRGGFRSLRVACGHVPPWIEAEALSCGLAYEAGEAGRNEYEIRLSTPDK